MGEEEECKRMKGKMTRRGKGVRNSSGRKERMDGLKWESRKECKRRKRKRWTTRRRKRRKEFKRSKGKVGWPEVGKEEGIQEKERNGWMTRSGRVGRNAMVGKDGTEKQGRDEQPVYRV